MLLLFVFLPLLASFLFVVPCLALICYENDSEEGIVEVRNSTWSYCAFVPPSGNETIGRVFGLSSLSDSTENYDNAFAENDEDYAILTLCFLERYNFGQAVGKKASLAEFLFRCVCNYDRCNSAVTFDTYLRALKTDSI